MYCRHGGFVSGVLLILVSMWSTLMGATANKWIVFAIGVILVLHGVSCRCGGCGNCECEMSGMKETREARRSARRARRR